MKSRARRKPKPLPDYGSKRVQIRLLAVVACLMLVLTLMNEARKPETWAWMWRLQTPQASLDELFGGGEVDTRFRRKPAPVRPPGLVYAEPTSGQTAGGEVAPRDGVLPTVPAPNRAPTSNSDQVSATAATPGDNLSRTTSDTALDQAKSEKQVPTGQPPALSDDSAAVAPDRERLPAEKTAAATAGPLRGSTVNHQTPLTTTELAKIEDDTVWRPAEREPWFKLFGSLQQMSPDQLQQSTEANVGFVQLFRQPSAYRGQLVTIRGQARLVYHVQAPKNELGISGYYVFWIRPKGGSNSPLVVYSLELPEGFPQVPDKDLDARTLEVDESVTVTGYFFKRWAYRARGGLHTAPMLLARVPLWVPAPDRADRFELPGPLTIAITLVLLVGVALLMTLWVYRSGQIRRSESGRDLQSATPETLASLQQLRVLPRPEEHLRELTQTSDRREST